jgi:hypothetical protein
MCPTNRLKGKIYRVEQNPRESPSVIIRLAAFGEKKLDDLPPEQTRDHIADGETLDEAIDKVLRKARVQS